MAAARIDVQYRVVQNGSRVNVGGRLSGIEQYRRRRLYDPRGR
jgi:hypothetical protein